MRMKPAAGIRILSIALVSLGVAGCNADCDPAIREAWLRSAPPTVRMNAGYATIVNDCDAPRVIVAASSPAFAEVTIHQTAVVDGVSRMRPVTEVELPAHGEVVLEPGGLHLMLSGPRQVESVRGTHVAVDFLLRDGGTLRGEFEVR